MSRTCVPWQLTDASDNLCKSLEQRGFLSSAKFWTWGLGVFCHKGK